MAACRYRKFASGKLQYLPLRIPRPNPPYDEMEGLVYHLAVTPTQALLRLPNEILDQIASNLVPSTVVHTMEGTSLARLAKSIHIPQGMYACRYMAQSSAHRQYLWELSALVCLALVCQRFRWIVERILYRDISLPTPPLDKSLGFFQYPISSVVRLTRTLIYRPDLAALIRSLKLWIFDRRLVSRASEPNLHPGNPYYDVFKVASEQVDRSQLPLVDRMRWVRELKRYQELDISAYLITLIPDVESLELLWPYSLSRAYWQLDSRGRQRPQHERPNYPCLDVALFYARSLKSLYVTSHVPLNTIASGSLTQLTLDMLFFADRQDWSTFSCLASVKALTVEVNVPQLKDIDIINTFQVDPFEGLRTFLECVVPGIETIAIEPCQGTDPPVGCQFDGWGREIPVLRMDEDPYDVNEVRIGHALIDEDFFTDLYVALLPVKDKLLHLSLPTNWYCSAGMGAKPIGELELFSRLETLRLPKLAIVANKYSNDYDTNIDDSHAEIFLPPSLQMLTITQVDMEMCKWLQEGFRKAAQDGNRLRHLVEVHLFFRDDYTAVVPPALERDANLVNVQITLHWRDKTEVGGVDTFEG